MADLLQRMDAWQWWLIASVLMMAALTARRRFILWPGLTAMLTGYLVFIHPGMFWYRQWMYFAVPGLLLAWLDRPPAGSS